MRIYKTHGQCYLSLQPELEVPLSQASQFITQGQGEGEGVMELVTLGHGDLGLSLVLASNQTLGLLGSSLRVA